MNSEIDRLITMYKLDIARIELQINSLVYKKKELSALINGDIINKLREINEIESDEPYKMQQILKETPTIELLSECRDEIGRELLRLKSELELKQTLHEKLKKHLYNSCDHLWISDHFENPALMCMVGCTYCNICGMVRDDV